MTATDAAFGRICPEAEQSGIRIYKNAPFQARKKSRTAIAWSACCRAAFLFFQREETASASALTAARDSSESALRTVTVVPISERSFISEKTAFTVLAAEGAHEPFSITAKLREFQFFDFSLRRNSSIGRNTPAS